MEANAADVVRKFAPNAKPQYLEAFTTGQTLLDEYGVSTPLRLAHFMAQIMYETGSLTTLRENGRYTAENLARMWDKGSWHRYFPNKEACVAMAPQNTADDGRQLFNLVYSNRRGNGPPDSGEGWKYRGGGLLQTTGKVDYARYSEIFGVDFLGDPDLIFAPEHALKPALREWSESHLNAAADRNDVEVISKRINGSLKSVNDRRARFEKISRFLSVREPVENGREWKVQEKLSAAGYDEVKADGVVGPVTRAAILSYRHRNGLEPGLHIGADLLASLGLDELAQIDRLPNIPALAAPGAGSPDAGNIDRLVQLGSTPEGLAAARSAAKSRMDEYPINGCAAHLSALLNHAGIDVRPTRGAGRLASRLTIRGWGRVEVGNQRAGDIGVTLDRDPTPPGADHVYLVLRNIDGDLMDIADNQNPEDAPHRRRASGGGKTRTEYFLRA